MRARGERQIFDQRVLGDGEFVEQVLSEMDEQSKENLRIRRNGIDLSLLAKKVCNVDGVSVGELRSGSRRREIVNSRGVFSWLAVRELGYSGAEVARFLGVTTSCVTRAVLSGEGPKVKGYL